MVLERYERLLADDEDVAAFHAVCERPLPHVVRVNSIKATPERARRALSEGGHVARQVEWEPTLLELDTASPGTTWPYVHGWLYGQEEVSALPALVLDPQPGERVLDTCAAPGSKTTHLAALMDDTGTLVANDNSLGRLSALRSNAERCGVTNLVVTRQDARNYSLKPFVAERDDERAAPSATNNRGEPLFDRTLVDAPCSCEGTIRKNRDALDDWSLDYVESIAEVQRAILRRAIGVTRPGGTVVYSTCTFAPEENEAVLHDVVTTEPCRLVPFETPLETRPGVTAWGEESYDESVALARRLYPQDNDTGGFFCAKLAVEA